MHTPQTCGFPGSSEGKESACNWETWVRFLGWEDPLEKGMATRVRILAWKSPLIEEPGMLQSVGSQRVGHDWVTNTFTFRISEAPEQRPLWPEGWRWPLNTFMDGEIWETRFLVSPSINPSIFSSIHLLKTKTKKTKVMSIRSVMPSNHLILCPSPPAFSLSQHQGLFKWVSSSHQVAKELEFQLQHQSFQ